MLGDSIIFIGNKTSSEVITLGSSTGRISLLKILSNINLASDLAASKES